MFPTMRDVTFSSRRRILMENSTGRHCLPGFGRGFECVTPPTRRNQGIMFLRYSLVRGTIRRILFQFSVRETVLSPIPSSDSVCQCGSRRLPVVSVGDFKKKTNREIREDGVRNLSGKSIPPRWNRHMRGEIVVNHESIEWRTRLTRRW